MQITSFKDMYIAELQELANMERQMGEGLLRMSGAASHPSLKAALQRHREQTRTQMDRLEQMLRKHGSSPYVHTNQAVEALVAETEKMLKLVKGNDPRDAALIASAQKLEHYEMAPTAPRPRWPAGSSSARISACCTTASRRSVRLTRC